MNKTDEFLDIYKKLEQYAITRYGFADDGKAVQNLEKEPEYRSIKQELRYCREVRNLLQHKPKMESSFAVVPSEEMIDLLKRTIEKVINPPKALSIAVPFQKVMYKSMDDHVLSAMKEMNEKVYTHVPILKDGKVEGVFSENTLLSYLVDEEIVCIDSNLTFSDIAKYLPIKKHRAETFRFVSRDALLYEVSQLFDNALKKSERIGMVFITQHGGENERVLGIITAWDVAGAR